jgi:hypothetical protein
MAVSDCHGLVLSQGCSTPSNQQIMKATDTGVGIAAVRAVGMLCPPGNSALETIPFQKTAIRREQTLFRAHTYSAGAKTSDGILRENISRYVGLLFFRFRFYGDVTKACLEKINFDAIFRFVSRAVSGSKIAFS